MPATAAKIDDEALIPDGLEAEIEKIIAYLLQTNKLSLSTRVALEGHVFNIGRDKKKVDKNGNLLPFDKQNFMQFPPLEAAMASKNPIHDHQYLAGCRFRLDWHHSQISPLSAIDYTAHAVFVTEWMLSHGISLDGPKLAKVLRSTSAIADYKIEAMKRMGDACDYIGTTSAFIATKVLCEDYRIPELAEMLEVDRRYATQRFKETLDDLARYYGMLGGARIERKAKR